MQCLQSQTHLPPRLSVIRSRIRPSKTPAGACLPWQAQPKDQLKTLVSEQALGTATQPQVPQPSQSSCGSCHPGLSLNTGRVPPISSFAQKKSDLLPGGELEALAGPPLAPSHQDSPNPGRRGLGQEPWRSGVQRERAGSAGFPPQCRSPTTQSSAPNAPLGRERREAPGDTRWGHSC